MNRNEQKNNAEPQQADKDLTLPNEDIQRKIDMEQAEALTSRAAGDTTVSPVGNNG